MNGWMMVFFVAFGVLMIALAIPMMRGRVKPNSWYGFRTTRTLEDPEVWYAVNAYAGKQLVVYGLVNIAAAVGFFFVPGLSEDGYVILLTLIMLAGILLVLLLGWRYSKRI